MNALNSVTDAAGNAGNQVTQGASDAGKGAQNTLGGAGNQAQKAMGSAHDTAADTASKGGDKAQEAGTQASQTASKGAESAKETGSKASESAPTQQGQSSSGGGGGIPGLSSVTDAAGNAGSSVTGGLSSAGNTVSDAAGSAGGQVSSGAQSAGNTVTEGASSAGSQIPGSSQIQSGASSAVGHAQTGIGKGAEGVQTITGNIPVVGKITEGVGNMPIAQQIAGKDPEAGEKGYLQTAYEYLEAGVEYVYDAAGNVIGTKKKGESVEEAEKGGTAKEGAAEEVKKAQG